MNLANKVVFNKDFESNYILNINIAMKKILIVINSNLRAVKYKKVKQIKLNSSEIIEIFKKFKRLTQIIRKQFDSVDIIKQILNMFIKIQFRKLFNVFFELFKQIFRSIMNKEIRTMSKKNHCVIKSRKEKEKAC